MTSATRRTAGGVPQSLTRFWYAKATATPAYDPDGNLLSDARNTTSLAEEGRWVYTWDAENRLIQMETPASYTASGGFYTKLTFEYNWEGKRIACHLWTGGTPSSPTFVSSKRWLYDGWNPVAEFTATAHDLETGAAAAALNRYTWGLDLGDTGEGIARPGQMLQRAGGVGGLLLQTTVSGSVLERPSYDGNGNIVAWTKSTAAAPTVRREYDAFGNVVMSEGTSPSEFGFSTKLEDPRSGLVYYGYRYYQPEHGRWINRDPIEENGGINLYGFSENAATQMIDILGNAAVSTIQGPSGAAALANWQASSGINVAANAALAAELVKRRRCSEMGMQKRRSINVAEGLGACKGGMTCWELRMRRNAWEANAEDRWNYDKECENGGDRGHQLAQRAAYNALKQCRKLMRSACCAD